MRQLVEGQRLLRADEYERLAGTGVFSNERVELVHGIIVRMSPMHEPHAQVIQILTRLLARTLGDRADVRVQLPFSCGETSLPEPDLAIVAPNNFGDPRPNTAFLIIEVAETSLDYDRHEKSALYAAAGVSEYWIVNIRDRAIEVHSEPSIDGYARVNPSRRGDKVSPAAFPDVVIDVRALFGG
jgi:Uma2 family endonuclease